MNGVRLSNSLFPGTPGVGVFFFARVLGPVSAPVPLFAETE